MGRRGRARPFHDERPGTVCSSHAWFAARGLPTLMGEILVRPTWTAWEARPRHETAGAGGTVTRFVHRRWEESRFAKAG